MSNTPLTLADVTRQIDHLGRRASPARVADLLEALQADPAWHQGHCLAEQRLWHMTGITPAFAAHMDKANTELSRRLWGQLTPRQFNAQWAQMDRKARTALLEKAVDLQARLYGCTGVAVTPHDFSAQSTGDRQILGRYLPDGGRILISDQPAHGVWHNGTAALLTALHEGCHAIQHQLVQKLDAGQLTATHPWHDQARLFRASFTATRLMQQTGAGILPFNYTAIPTERHAHAVEGVLRKSGNRAGIMRLFKAAPTGPNRLLAELARPVPQDLQPPPAPTP